MVVAHRDGTSTREYSDEVLRTKRKSEDSENAEESSKDIPNAFEIKLFRIRWLILGLFVVCSALNNMQTFQYTIIANIIRRYYNVSSLAVDWTLMIFMVTYLVLVVPSSYLMDRVGLRWTALIVGIGTCLGAWIKFFSTSQDRFAVALLGQFMVGVTHVGIITIPGRLSAHWFGPKEVASATAIACIGGQIGCALCYAITPHVVRNHEKIEDIGKDLSTLLLVQAILCTVSTVALIFFFQDGPPLPPSDTRALQKANREIETVAFLPTVKRLLRNKYFLCLCNAYGFLFSILLALGAVLNPMYLAHFKNGEKEIGRLGLVSIGVGFFGTMGFAFILDKTKKFREIAIFLCLFALLTEILFAVACIMEIKWLVFVSFVAFGCSAVSYSVVGIDLCIEITYPESEAMSTGILNILTQIYGTLSIFICGRLIEAYGDRAGHAYLCGSIIISTVFTVINKGELRRQKAARIAEYDAVPLQVLQPMTT